MRVFVCAVLFLGCVGLAWGHDTNTDANNGWFHPTGRSYPLEGDCDRSESRYTDLYIRKVEGSPDRHWHFKFTTKTLTGAVADHNVGDCGDWSVGSWKSIVVEAYEEEVDARKGPGSDGSYYPCAGDYPCPTDNVQEDTDTLTEVDTPKPKNRKRRSSGSSSVSVTVEETFDEVVSSSDSYYQPEPSIVERIIPPVPEPEPEPIVTEIHEFRLFKGYTMVGFPVHMLENRKVGEIYRDNDFFDSDSEGILIHLPVEGVDDSWYFFNGDGVFGHLPLPLSRHFGIIVVLDEEATWEIEGVPVQGRDHVVIEPGVNLVGFPEVPAAYQVPSDFLLDGICFVGVSTETGLHGIGRAGDPGDELIYAGQAVLLWASKRIVLDLSGSVLAAPMAPRVGSFTTTWGAIKSR